MPPFASSQEPRCVLPPCHTPVKSGFPVDARGTVLFAGALAVVALGRGAVCAYDATGHKAAARIAVRPRARIIAPPLRECSLHRRFRPVVRRTTSFHQAR